MKIILIGGFGFIGRYIIRLLAEEGHNLVVFSTDHAILESEPFARAHKVRSIVCNIKNEELVKQLVNAEVPDAVVQLAAVTGLSRCNLNPSLAFSTNIYGTYNVVKSCVEVCARLIFISSREVYGDTIGPTPEEAPSAPNNIYGLTKLLAEKIILWAADKFGLDYTILRLTNVYGPEGDQYNIQAMIKLAKSQGTIPILGGNQRMNFVYVEDVAKVIKLCLQDKRSSRAILNVGSEDNLTVDVLVSRLVSELENLLSKKIYIRREPMRKGETLNFEPNLSKLQQILGYVPETNLTAGLQKTLKWYIEDFNQT